MPDRRVTNKTELIARCLARLGRVSHLTLDEVIAWYREDVKSLLEVIDLDTVIEHRDATPPPPMPADKDRDTIPGSPYGRKQSSRRMAAVVIPSISGVVPSEEEEEHTSPDHAGDTGRLPPVLFPEGPPPAPAEDSDPGDRPSYIDERTGTRIINIHDLDDDDDDGDCA